MTTLTPPATGPIASFTWNLPYGEPTSLDPAFAQNYSENTVLGNICEGLLRETPTRKIVPNLAQSVSHPNPTTWIYKIRKGVTYFDGNPMTPADVVFNLHRQMDPSLGSYYYESFASKVKSVSQTGPDEVTMVTKTPNVLVNEMLVSGFGTIVEPKAIEEGGKNFGSAASTDTLQCTGPFQVESWEPGSSIVLKKNDHYWDKSIQPKASKVKFSFITDQTALANALVSGEIDGTFEAPVSALGRLQGDANGSLYLGPSTQVLELYSFGTPATSNVNVRKALYYAIDREGIAQTAFGGAALPMKTLGSPTIPSTDVQAYQSYYDSIPDPGPDIAKAKSFVEKAGTTSPIRLAVPAGDPSLLQTVNAIQSAAKEAGLDMVISTLPTQKYNVLYYERATAKANYDMMIYPTYVDIPSVLEAYNLQVLPESIFNISEYDNPRVNAAVAEGVSTTNAGTQAEKAIEATEEVDNDLPYIPIVATPERLFMNNRIAGAPATYPYLYYPWAAYVGAGSK